MKFTFTLKYRLPADACKLDVLLERLGAHGCDDALIGTGVAGRVALEFTREASSVEEAVCSALTDIRQALAAIPGKRLLSLVA